MDVRNRVAVITGGGTGMGFAAAEALSAAGARVALLGRREAVVAERAALVGGIGIGCDVGDETSVEAALSSIEDRLGTPSILINSAADGRLLNLVSPQGVPVSGDYIRETLATNVAGILYMARGFAVRRARLPVTPELPGGVIINVSSISAADGGMGSAYPISKGAVDAAALTLAREFSAWGIRVVTISPGGIDTELFRQGATEGTLRMLAAMVPGLRRPGRPDEFGRLALHVCENDYINGANIRLDGGLRSPFSADIGGGVEAPQ